MSDFVVFATWESVWSSFASNPLVMGGARDATIGDENSTVDVGANTEFTYTGIPSGSTAYNGPYSLYEFTLSNGGQAVWMAGVGNSGGIVVPLDATAYDTFVNGTTFTVASSTALSQYAYSSFYTPPINQPPTGSVTISGTASEGQTLTASNSISDADGVGTISYQWKRDGVDISGANGSTYTLTQTDVGAAITVTASYTDNAGNPESVTSSATAAVTNVNDAPTGSVNIVGTAAEDQVLTATNSLADEDGLGSVTYQWQRDGVDITAATASTYALSQEDVGATITVVASYTDGGGTTESVTSAGTAPVANVNDDPTGNVTIVGNATEKQTLAATHTLADEDGLGTITYQWQRDGVNISGATGVTYTLTQDDVGAVVTVAATYTDGEGTTESVTSAATATVTNVNDDPTGSVTIVGTAAEDQTLTAANTLADEDGLGTIAYQWKRDGVDISGASGSTYTLTQDDVGAVITVAATYTDGEGTTESVTSAATATVTNVNDDPTGSVTIAGTAAEDQTLTAANTLADEDGLGTIAYQWKRDGADISGASGNTYTLTQDDVGAVITVAASYTDGEGTTESVTSAATATVTNVNDDPTGSVTIAGTAAEDQTLTAANTLADEDGLGTITYQWKRDGVDISGASGSTYTLTQDDVGAVITVAATYTDGEGTTESVTSAATATVTNVNDDPTGSVTIAGTAAEDQTLTAANTLADEDGLGTITYQWKRDGVDISGASGSTYTLTQDDVGAVITVAATYTDGEGTTESVTSAATATVTNVNDDPTGSVTIAGTAAEDQTLTAANTLADEDGLGTITYQWKRDGVDISGASGSTYTLTQDDVGAVITVAATYTDGEGTTESVTSAATATVTNVNDDPTGSVTIAGTAAEDQTLTAANTLADEDGLGTIAYQWKRDGGDISGASGSTYTLTQDDVGAVITVAATYTDGEGTTESVTSAATATVTNVNDDPTGSVTIAGTAAEDQTLTTANTLADEDGLGTIAYQWKRDGADISGANGSTYTLTQDDVGAVITVAASYTDDEGTTESVTSAATATVTNVNDDPTGSVTIAGTAAEDQTLTAANTLADEDGLGTIAYQWKRDGVDISGANGSTYTLTQDDVGAVITVAASYTDGEGTTESVTSAATTTVTNVNDDPTGSVSIVGTAAEDQTLTTANTLADEDGLGTIAYQWKRDGVDISGANGSTYTLTQDDVGAVITVAATYTDGEGTTESVTSAATATVTNVNDDPTGSVSIVGTAAEDQTLTTANTLADEDGLGTIAYQWQRDGADISGAGGSTYTLTQDDVGAVITVAASYTDGEGTTESVTSAATATVTNVNDDPTGSVIIAGAATQGQTLTATNTLADEDGLGSISYQWKRDGVDIAGATGDTYTLSEEDVGATITTEASYLDGGGTTEVAFSEGTTAIRYGDLHQVGTSDDDEMRGRYGDDALTGGEGEDSIVGGLGHDSLKGNTGSDSLHGWRGNDLLVGGKDEDALYGGKGNDTLEGGTGNDLLLGRLDDDVIAGGKGRDTLKGGKGDDLLTGGFGADTFVFGRDHGNDTITDFGQGNDLIEIIRGAKSLSQVTFSQDGNDVLLSFGSTTVLVESTTVAELNDADHFLFT